MTTEAKLRILSFILYIAGTTIIIFYSRWEVMLGLFLFSFGSNIERRFLWKEDIKKSWGFLGKK